MIVLITYSVVLIRWIILVYLFVGYYIYTLSVYYLHSQRSIRRILQTSESPVYSQFEECLNNLSVIRTCGYQQLMTKRSTQKIRTHSTVFWLSYITQRWFALRIESSIAFITLIMGVIFIYMSTSYSVESPGLLALALLYTGDCARAIQMALRNYIQYESCAVSLERLEHLAQITPKELARCTNDDPIPSEWPNKGNIEFRNVSFRYRTDTPKVLK
eukprot:UN28191